MRLRFAPSPTGYLHIGNARTAMLNYLIKRKHNATLIIRVEDTDLERSSIESEQSILDDLRWLGIEWDEGPDKGGEYGPYRQSERFDIYKKYTEKLLSEDKAYYCYCTEEELHDMRQGASGQESFVYPGRCRNLSEKEREEHESHGIKPTVRFKIPAGERVAVNDLIKEKVVFDSENIGGDFIIVRSDGTPVYNYIVIIDDALMNISHVIRGEDHLSNTPKQILIARALNLPIPEYAHHALVLGPDRSKLSKRHGITSVQMYRKEGYLPDALLNYTSMLGWAAESGEEILSIDDIVNQFEIKNLSGSAAIFDFQKLRWMNGNYIRSYPLDKIMELFTPYIEEAAYPVDNIQRDWLESVISLIRGNCEVLSEIKNHIGLFLGDIIEPDTEADNLLKEDDSRIIISAAYDLIHSSINEDNYVTDLIPSITGDTGLKGKKLFLPIRAIITGRLKGPELDKALALIGYEKSRKRIEFMYTRYATKK